MQPRCASEPTHRGRDAAFGSRAFGDLTIERSACRTAYDRARDLLAKLTGLLKFSGLEMEGTRNATG